MTQTLSGIVPVMITPFTETDDIDYDSLEQLVNWYVENGSDTLFAVCQSSEMTALSLAERVELARKTVAFADGRLPVIASGHISDDAAGQREELSAMADTGIDGLVLVTNRMDPGNAGTEAFRAGLDLALSAVPGDMPLGLYECPAPYRRLMSDDEFKLCRDTGRFRTLKDVSCDLGTVRRRCTLAEGSGFEVVNANAAIAADAMRSGSAGFAGVMSNFHPDLYAWLYANQNAGTPLARELETFLALSAMIEPMGYPKLAKHYHQKLGTLQHTHTRVVQGDIFERFWALEPLLDHLTTGAGQFRARIAYA